MLLNSTILCSVLYRTFFRSLPNSVTEWRSRPLFIDFAGARRTAISLFVRRGLSIPVRFVRRALSIDVRLVRQALCMSAAISLSET